MLTNPQKIEQKSFDIIRQEAALDNFSAEEQKIVMRAIHATADLEYADIIHFHKDAVARGLAALRNGCKIYTDTRMSYSGINKNRLKQTGCSLLTYIDDPGIALAARQRGITRSMLGIEKAVEDKQVKIFLIGNAPTALFILMDLIKMSVVKPDLVIGVPVGFVGAAESKEQLMQSGVPWITVRGRKGGSPVAVSILHGLLYQLQESSNA